MDVIVDLNAERLRRAEPALGCVVCDEYGRTLYTFLTEWTLADGRTFGGEILAYDEAEAEAHAQAMRATLRVAGKLFDRIPL